MAQGQLSGTVRDSLTQQPLPFASVFLVSTTRGVTADAQGRYVLPNVPAGRYELAATFLGYQLRQQPVVVANAPVSIGFNLPPATQALPEVVVRPNPHRAADYQYFLELLLGTSTLAQQCRVRTPNAVEVDYDALQNVLTAQAPGLFVVDNLALGYRLTFHGLRLRADFAGQSQRLTTLSQIAFEELPGGRARQRRWATNRQRAYAGSGMHFLRCVYTNTLSEADFRVQRLRRVPNRRRAVADSLLQARLALGPVGQVAVPDSVNELLRQPPYVSYLYTPLLPADSLRRTADGRVWLRFRDLLAITYLPERPDPNYRLPGLMPAALPSHQESVLHLRQPPEVELEASGTLTEPLCLLSEGYWGFEKTAELLPLDYMPSTTP